MVPDQVTPSKIAYLGSRGSFSSIAALKMSQNVADALENRSDLHAVVNSVLDDEAPSISSGVLPIENNVAGFVGETLDLLLDNDILIVDSVHLPISFTAYYLPSVDISTTKFILARAHPHALSQCSSFIRRHNLTSVAALSASQAVLDLDEVSVALAPTQSPEFSEYKSFERGVQDYSSGKTQFVKFIKYKPLVITNITQMDELQVLRTPESSGVVVVIIPKINRVGALHEVLAEVFNSSINIGSLISRPIKGVDDLYSFFLTLETTVDDNLLKCLKAVENHNSYVRILGGYVDETN